MQDHGSFGGTCHYCLLSCMCACVCVCVCVLAGQIVIGVQKGGLRPAWPPGQLPQLQELYER